MSTALFDALQQGDREEIGACLRRGFPAVNDREENTQRTPLHVACQRFDLDSMQLPIEHGADVNSSQDNEGNTPLLIVLDKWINEPWELEMEAALTLLWDAGARSDLSNLHGQSSLHLAARHGTMGELSQRLVEEGADVNRPNEQGNTPLHVALSEKNDAVARVLLNAGARVQVPNAKGQTALHMVASANSEDTVNLTTTLLGHGARIGATDHFGRTPLHAASVSGNSRTVRLFLDPAATRTSAR